jgi:hypothetical protein
VKEVKPRELTTSEAAILEKVLMSGDFVGAPELQRQIQRARVSGGLPTLLDLKVDHAAARSPAANGPVPVRAVVRRQANVIGEILVWVEDGFLAGLEFAWVSDEEPVQFPLPSDVRVDIS